MLARARERVRGLDVEFLQADLFDWRPAGRFDTVFFGLWLSHVPADLFGAFWDMVGRALKPGGRACFIDSSTGEEESRPGPGEDVARRRLADGSTYRIVKVLHEPAALTAKLGDLGWTARIWPVSATLLAGEAQR